MFLLAEPPKARSDILPRLRFLVARMERPLETRFYFMEQGDFGQTRIAYGNSPETEFLGVDTAGKVYGYNPPRTAREADHPSQTPGSSLAGVVTQVVRIGGTIYTVGGPRRLHRRLGIGQWEDLTASLKLPADVDEPGKSLDYLWQSADGFAADDLYAVGGAGDVFHFDGKQWRQCRFLTDELLFTVCCGGDGQVYIGGQQGTLYVGRGDTWKKLSGGGGGVPWTDLAWFGDRLWLVSSFSQGLCVLKGSQVVPADLPAEISSLICGGALDVSPDGRRLLAAGSDGACLFDGTTWKVLFNRYELE
jgi:hypothetical protein